MDKQRIIREWREATENAIEALQAWLSALQEWERNGSERQSGDFEKAFTRLYVAGLGDGWADRCPAGGRLDRLADAVSGDCQSNKSAYPSTPEGQAPGD